LPDDVFSLQMAPAPRAEQFALLVQGPPYVGAPHAPLVQAWPAGHWVQTEPLFPHALGSVPALQTLPTQQPPHVAGPHGAVAQAPFWQACPAGHDLHCAPLTPQFAALWLPGGIQTPFAQQPPHDMMLQGFVTHLPITQPKPSPHAWHVAPCWPHAAVLCCGGGTQTPLRQQPVGQLAGLQPVVTHWPIAQTWFGLHARQTLPLIPQR